jgi:apolipoprotein D and lipocalin family protein
MMTRAVTMAAALAALLFSAGSTVAAAPQPMKPVPLALYSGRWYEIARTQNRMQPDCQGGTSEFRDWSPSGAFSVIQTCHKGSPRGPKQQITASGHILPGCANAKMKLGMLGGLISQEYWIVDHADNGAWAIMDRADGRYVWLLSRQPTLTSADKAAAMARLQQLGFDMTRLAFPKQLASE